MTTAVLGGLFIIGAMLVLMNYNHPYSEFTRRYYVTTPIVPNVNGSVIDVPHRSAAYVNKGDILFRIDPVPFEHTLAQLEAKLYRIEEDEKRAVTLLKKGVGSQRDVDQASSRLKEVKAQIAQARWNLEQTVFRAPDNGHILQVALRPGMRAVSLPLRPVMNFIHDEKTRYIGWFRQNSTLRLKPGDDAEIALTALPGEVFKAKVEFVSPAIAEGQFNAFSQLMSEPSRRSRIAGRIAVELVITDPRFAELEKIYRAVSVVFRQFIQST